MKKIGIFDSGLGGLFITKAIWKALPEYDYVYLGDTKRVPYGNRSHEAVLEFSRNAVNYLFEKEKCLMVIIACNTASAKALKELQKEMPERKIFGVIAPVAQKCEGLKRVGVIGTSATVGSGAFSEEIKKIDKDIAVFQNPAPMLVPLVENMENKNAMPFIKKYLAPLLKKKIDALILGCTHYPYLKKEIKSLLPKNVKIISQDEIIPKKLKGYLASHPQVTKKLSKNHKMKILVTDKTKSMEVLVRKWFSKTSDIGVVEI